MGDMKENVDNLITKLCLNPNNVFHMPPKKDNKSIEILAANGKIVSPKKSDSGKKVNPQGGSIPEAVPVNETHHQTAQSSTTSSTITEDECASCFQTKPAAVVLACSE